jgi:hypothetical protein
LPREEVGTMNSKQQENLLEDNGFEYKRRGKHGEIWGDGFSIIQVSGSPSDHRTQANFQAEIKRALKKREMKLGPKSIVPLSERKRLERQARDAANSKIDEEKLETFFLATDPTAPMPKPTPAPMAAPPELEAPTIKLMQVSKAERTERGKALWARLQLGESPLLTKDDMADLFTFAGYASGPSMVGGILAGNVKSLSFVKDKQSGALFFESKEVREYLKDRIERASIAPAAPEVTDIPVPFTPPAFLTPAPAKPALKLEPWAEEFYVRVATKLGITPEEAMARALSRMARTELDRIETKLAEEMGRRRTELLAMMEVDL